MRVKTKASTWLPMHPDMVLFSGNVITVDEEFSVAEAVAVKGDRIVGVGSSDDMKALAGSRTALVNLHGATLLPGINDAHCHLSGFGLSRPPLVVDLSFPTVKSIEDISKATAAKVSDTPPGKWISGSGWDRGFLDELKGKPDLWPTKDDIDPVSARNPVVYTDFSGHVCLASSEALRLAGVDRNTPDPEGGIIQRDASGDTFLSCSREPKSDANRRAP